MSTGYPIIESIVSTIKCARWRGMEADNQADEPKGAAKPEDKDPLDEIIERINEKYKGNFTEADRIMINALAEKLRGNQKLANMAVSSDPQIFAESIFSQAFSDATQDSYMESRETYSSLFEDRSKYNAIMSTLANILYHDMRRPGGKQ